MSTIDFAQHWSLFNIPLSTFLFGGVSLAAVCSWCSKPNLDHIPTVGSTGLVSYLDSFRFIRNAQEILQEGYDMFRGGAFRIPFPDKWVVVVNTLDLVNELRLAKDEDLSFIEASADDLQAKYTLDESVVSNPYHAQVIRSPLTRNLGARFDEVHDEIVQAFEDMIPLAACDKEWASVTALPVIQEIVARTSNRLFFGLPICRNPEWIKFNVQYTIDAFSTAIFLNIMPSFLQPILGYWLSPIGRALRLGRKHLQKEITERIRMDDEHGKDYGGRPNDLISWLLEYAQVEEKTCDKLIARILVVNIAAIHSSSNSFAQALFNLAAHPQYAKPIRQEILTIVKEEGWTKAAISKMHMIDSFLKESARMEGLGGIMLNRKVVNPAGYTFANGLYVPYGTIVAAPSFSIHHDAELYNDPFTFDGFRFSNMRNRGNEESFKHQMVETSLQYLHFGHGKHACPGRIFAASELKTMLAHVLVTYEVAFEGEDRPKNLWLGVNIVPDPKAKILFKRLQT